MSAGASLLLFAPAAGAEQLTETLRENESARIYRTPEERRDAGLGREITEWLTISSLVEFEDERQRSEFNDNKTLTENERATLTLQIGLDLAISEWLRAELIFEAESNGANNHSQLDEGFISAEIEEWGIEIGRQSVPFGEYYSHFVTGPLLEFGETRADSLIVDYEIADHVELTGFVIDSEVRRQTKGDSYDWGARIEFSSENESRVLGISYLSDLAESNEELLKDENNIFERKVPAWNVYGLYGFSQFEVTAEIVSAIHEFAEFEPASDSPSAYNVELAYFPAATVQLAIRTEHSDEFEEAPRQQYGISATWRPVDKFSISIDYLRASYKNGFVVDEDDNELEHSNSIAAQLAMEW